MKKTTPLNLMLEKETKKKIKEKADKLGLSLTGYIEKIANEPVVFLDANVKSLMKMLQQPST